MKTETIENILNFLQEKEGKEIPKSWFKLIEKLKLIKEIENHPDDIQYRYKGDLVLKNSNITKLPNDLYVTGYLDLGDCKQLTKLPDNLYVGDELYLKGCTQITKLPDNLYVGDSLNIKETSIEEIPNNIYVDLSLYIENTPLAKKYTDKEIYEMIKLRGGELVGKIFR